MATVKVIISLDESLFHEIEQTAADLNISQDRFWEIVTEEFLQRRKNRPSLEEINSVYTDPLDEEEQHTLKAMARLMYKIADPWE